MPQTLYCFDLDGTITNTEILPCIASELGIAAEMAALTRATMDGLIPFDASFRLRCLLLGQISVARVCEIVAQIPLNSDIFEFICSRKDRCCVVTGNLDIWIRPLVEKLGCRVFSSQGKFCDGLLRVESILDKAEAVADLKKNGCDRVVAVGDGANDASMLKAASLGIAYGGIHAPAAQAIAASDAVIFESRTLCRVLKTL